MSDTFQGVAPIASIDTASLRQTLRQTMVLGLPDTDSEKPTFYWERINTWDSHDNENQPWDWTSAPTLVEAPAAQQVICAYEFFSPLGRQGSSQTEVGEFNPTTLVITMFEDEFAVISGFSYCTIGPGDQRWYFRFWRPASSLADMTVYQVQCVAQGIE